MTIFAKLALGFGAVLVMLGASGALTLENLNELRETDEHVRERVSFNELTLQYRHAAMEAVLGASQMATGNVMGEQRIREGVAAMTQSRKGLEQRTLQKAARKDLAELVRVEKLTASAITRVTDLVNAKQPVELIQQELALLSARSDALNLGLDALFEDSRQEVAAAMESSREIGARVQQQTTYAIASCLVLALLVSALILRAIAGPIARLDAAVRHVTAGHLDHVIPITSSDEVGKLTQAFNEMTASLRTSMAALDGRNRDLRVVLDHVHQGLLTMRRDGTTLAERSAIVETWLGPIAPDIALWNALRREQPAFAESLRTAFEAVIANEMPLELTLEKMPKVLKRGSRQLEFEYRPIFEGETLAKLLIVISDASDRVAREEASAHERETMAIFKAMQRDKQGFLDFVKDGADLLSTLSADKAPQDPNVLRQLRTLKEDSANFAIDGITSTCQELETALATAGHAACAPLWAALNRRWAELGEIIAKVSGDAKARIEIDDDDYTAILDAIMQGRPRAEIAQMVAHWRMERVDHRLLRLGDQARGLAQRLGKGELQVVVDAGGGIRLPRESFASFWGALVHAIRNAIEHGIETSQERVERHKSESPTLTLRAEYVGEELAISVLDDGRGIDWTRIADEARQVGMPTETQDDLVEALFSEGLSTSGSVSGGAGRGLGMSALRAACSRLAGRIVIDSTLGSGTKLSFHFPIDATRDAAAIELASRIPAESLTPRPRVEAALEG